MRNMIVFHDQQTLIERIAHSGTRPIVWVLGSPLSMPEVPTLPGVPGVSGIIEIIRREYDADEPSRLDHRASIGGTEDYQRAFRDVYGRRGPDAANRIIRQAVIRSRYPGRDPDSLLAAAANGNIHVCRQIENDVDGWSLPSGVIALGEILTSGRLLCDLILTSNFDPLIEVGIGRAGGQSMTLALASYGSLAQTVSKGVRIVHFHGYWYGPEDTLHTPPQLRQKRPRLRSALSILLRECTVIVAAYSGWKDIFAQTLISVLRDEEVHPDVLWTFFKDYNATPQDFETDHKILFRQLRKGYNRGRVQFYSGINVNSFLCKLRERLAHSNAKLVPTFTAAQSKVIIKANGMVSRRYQESALRDALAGAQAVQIIGAHLMGKTTLLQWARSLALPGWNIAAVNATGLAGRSPLAFVQEIARVLGRDDLLATVTTEHANLLPARQAEQLLIKFLPIMLLVDNAEELSLPSHSFDVDFFDQLRAWTEDRSLLWISASPCDLASLYQQTGLSSRFLNNSCRVWVGQLTKDEQASLLSASSLTDAQRSYIQERAGTQIYSMIWLRDHFNNRRCGQSDEAILDQFESEMRPIFNNWWQRQGSMSRQLLKGCAVSPMNVGKQTDDQRRLARMLVVIGLLTEEEQQFFVRGNSWQEFLRHVE